MIGGESVKSKDVLATALSIGAMFYLSTLAFTPDAKKKIAARDNWTCGVSGCRWGSGWNLHFCHDMDRHQRTPDDNPDNGGLMRVDLHILQHLRAGQIREARLIYSQHTIRDYNWIARAAGVAKYQLTSELIGEYDEKPEFEYYQEVAERMSLEEYVSQTVMVEA